MLGGRRGHVAAVNWLTKKLKCEINVLESVHDVKWLHNETMFSVAQKSFVYIYDSQGTEIHCIRQLYNVLRMEFLPYHFLLACSTESGHLAWLDVSMGQLVSKFHARQGRLPHMTYNPYNATLLLGHSTVWSPMVREPLAKLLCQKTAIQAIHVDPSGRYLVTSAMDRSVNIWDVRAMKPLQSYRMRGVPSSIQLSQRGCLATATGNVVEVNNYPYSDDAAYLRFCGNQGSATHLQFCPYEDVLGVAMERGFASLVVPGSGEPNFDSLEPNPMSTTGQRREGEVKALLEKIQPELITLEPLDVAEVDVPSLHEKIEAQKQLMSLKVPKVNFTPRRNNKKGGGLREFTELKTQQKKESSLLAPEISSEPEPPKGPSL
ncbi:hypothetical protein B566_EDAN012102 [Ephemera danica]|nr:hypothetical protein B566_EDAN012102 [Ephemera danica]